MFDTIKQIFDNEHFTSEPHQLYDPIEYTLHLGGKRIRPFLLMTANRMFGGEDSQVRNAAIGIEVFHNFTLLHDDLMDKSPIRRGQPTVYRKWDENTAVLSGDTMFALAWRYFLAQPSPRLQEILYCFNQTAIEVCEGQQYDMNFEQSDQVSIDDYMMMIRLKTAVLLAGALKIGALYAGAPEADIEHLYQFGIHLGLAFQLADDLLDVYADEAVFGKAVGGDIKDNKKTFLYLKALELADETQREQLRTLFATTPEDEKGKFLQVKAIFDAVDVRKATVEAIASYTERCIDDINCIHTEEEKKAFVLSLVHSLQSRNK